MKISLQAWLSISLIVVAFVGGCKLGCNYGLKKSGVSTVEYKTKDSIVYVTVHDTIPVKSVPAITSVQSDESVPYVTYTSTSNDYNTVSTADCEVKLKESVAYVDTLKLSDSASFVVVKDTVSRNRIVGRSFTSNLVSKIEYKTTVVTVTKEAKQKMAFLVGAEIIANAQRLNYTGVAAGLKTRTGNLYTAGAGLVGNEIYYKAGVFFKLGK